MVLRLTRVTMAWWTERSERYAFCTALLEPGLEESARAFVRACSSLRSLPLPEASVAAPTSYVAPGGMRRKVSHARAWRIDGAKVSEIVVQPGTHGLGEELRALWVAGDGTVFAGGDMETGEPGRNTAVVYRTALNGTLAIDHTKPQSEVWSISGTSSRDVYVAGENTFAHFDGAEWKDLTPPAGHGVLSVYAADSNLWVSASAVGGGESEFSGGRSAAIGRKRPRSTLPSSPSSVAARAASSSRRRTSSSCAARPAVAGPASLGPLRDLTGGSNRRGPRGRT